MLAGDSQLGFGRALHATSQGLALALLRGAGRVLRNRQRAWRPDTEMLELKTLELKILN